MFCVRTLSVRRIVANRLAVAGVLALPLLFMPSVARAAASNTATASPIGPTELDHGYSDMYDLNFADAHQQFAKWMAEHPEDPFGPASDAVAYLFTEFNRLGILDVDLFANDTQYENRQKISPDPAVKVAFDQQLARANQLADSILEKSPLDPRALFVETLTNGLHADYAQMIEKRDFTGLQYTKVARRYADKLLTVAPQQYDAYLAVGLENYILGLKPAPVRWLLNMTGAQTNAVLGKQDMELAATKGHYLAPFAQLLLAVAALRDKDNAKARQLLSNLATEFPDNPLYSRQLAKIH